MSTILGSLSALISPAVIGNVGKQLGLSDELTRQGLAITNGVLAAGMARAAGTPEGAAAVAQMVDRADTGVLGNLGTVLASAVGTSNGAASQIFGQDLDLVLTGAKKASGIDIAPMIGLCAPVLLAVVKNLSTQQRLDADGIGKMLQSEVKGLGRRDGPTAQVLKEVFKPLEAQDKLKASFSAEEWTALRQAPVNAAALIMLADHSGRSGRSKEIEALNVTLSEAAASAGPTGLINLLFRDGVSEDVVEELVKAYRRADEGEVRQALLTPIAEATAIVRAKAKSESSAFQGLLIAVAQQVAAAAKEGGFLGMGGTNVSAEEKAAIDALVGALAAG